MEGGKQERGGEGGGKGGREVGREGGMNRRRRSTTEVSKSLHRPHSPRP